MTHRHRDDLTGEHAFGDAGQLTLFILFLAVWITDAFIFKYATLLNDYISFAVRLPLGIVVLLISGYLAWAGLKIVFIEVREKPHVIRKSVFGVVRGIPYTSAKYSSTWDCSCSARHWRVWRFGLSSSPFCITYRAMKRRCCWHGSARNTSST